MLRSLVISTLYPTDYNPVFGIFVENSVRALHKTGDIYQHVIAPQGCPPRLLQRSQRYNDLEKLPLSTMRNGIRVDYPRFFLIPQFGWPLNPYFILRSLVPHLMRLKDEGISFDLIDAQFFYPCGVAAARLGAIFGIPVLIKARGYDITGWGQRPWAARQMLRAAKQAARLSAVSKSLQQQMVQIGMQRDKIDIHYTGIDLDRFTLKPERPMNHPAHLVSIGSLIPRKGHDFLLRTMIHLPQDRLTIVGKGGERPKLERMIKDLGLADRVTLAGQCDYSEIPAILHKADILVSASHREGLANVWIEALATGTPVVATMTEGLAEVLTQPEFGKIVHERKPECFAKAVKEILSRNNRPEEVRKASSGFSWDVHAALKREQIGRIL